MLFPFFPFLLKRILLVITLPPDLIRQMVALPRYSGVLKGGVEVGVLERDLYAVGVRCNLGGVGANFIPCLGLPPDRHLQEYRRRGEEAYHNKEKELPRASKNNQINHSPKRSIS